MKVGDYVRTEKGGIGKIVEILKKCDKIVTNNDVFSEGWDGEKVNWCFQDEVIKPSQNIIDLIERFDLVNGHLVIRKMYEDEKDIPTMIKCVGDYYFKEEDIKSIVTHEMFESMKYKVGE